MLSQCNYSFKLQSSQSTALESICDTSSSDTFKKSCKLVICWQFAILMWQEKECRRRRKRFIKVAVLFVNWKADLVYLPPTTSLEALSHIWKVIWHLSADQRWSASVNISKLWQNSLDWKQICPVSDTSPALPSPLHNYVPSSLSITHSKYDRDAEG